VILDRRIVKRRRHEVPSSTERRRYGRRARPLEDSEILIRGWTVVRLP
jgi:hypothetical protein